VGIGLPRSQLIEVPVVAFLLEHPTAGPLLVDTGFHRSVAEGPAEERSRNLGPVGRVMSRDLSMRPEQAVGAQLRALSIDPREVGFVVMTHLHFDHASGLGELPDATVLVSGAEWNAARARGGLLHGYSAAQLDPRLHYRTIDFAAGRTRPRGPFERTVDVFGDGSVTLAYTPDTAPDTSR
jgi:N-acyl homoserine lactone hydrolase